MRYHELPPDAGRVIISLRDSGYDFNTAVADIVDNSIAAGADFVRIAAVCSANSGEITVAISDNGCGMGIDGLCNAMTYGSAKRENEHSLGKFGLGLKTASTSQCRRVSLISRKGGEISKLTLDVDHAESTGRWEYIEEDSTRQDRMYLDMAANGGTGTAVIWTKCDRIMGRSYKQPGGKTQQSAFSRKIEDLRFHLSMVFQRFLDRGDRRANNVRIVVNGDPIKPFDPFALDTRMSIQAFKGAKEFSPDGTTMRRGAIEANAYVVPSRDELQSGFLVDSVFPPRVSPDSMQGIYIYRENRLIHWGGWCGLYKTEFHHRLCRVELSFEANLDDYFSVDFQKSKIKLDGEVGEWLLEEVLPNARAMAADRYRKGSASSAVKSFDVLHSRSNATISKMEKNDKGRQFSVHELGGGVREITSGKGRSFVEAIPQTPNSGMKTNIRLVDSLPDGSLWRAGLFKDGGVPRTYVEINAGHAFYQRAYYACKGNSSAVRCLDYLIWSLAQAEYATKDQDSRENYEDLVIEVSRTLRLLAEDLPVNES